VAFQSNPDILASWTHRQILEAFDARMNLPPGTVLPNGNLAAKEPGVTYFRLSDGSYWMAVEADGTVEGTVWTQFVTSFTDATDENAGLIKIANNAQVAALTITDAGITPGGLGAIVSVAATASKLVKRTLAGRIKATDGEDVDDCVTISQFEGQVDFLDGRISDL